MNNEIIMTLAELSSKLGTDYQATLGLVTFLISKGIVRKLDEKRAQVGKRGKPSNLYMVPKGPIFFDLVPKDVIKNDIIAVV